MEFQEVVRRRRMVRNFEDRPVPAEVLDRILANAVRAPSAGFTQGTAFLVLEGRHHTEQFWSVTFAGRDRNAFRWPGLFRAPVIVVPLSSKHAYLERYSEPDKGVTDRDESFWPVPYWDVDAGFCTLLVLLTAVDAGLGALFFAVSPRDVAAVRAAFAVPDTHFPMGAVALGWPAPDEPSSSLARGRRPLDEVVHRGRWGSGLTGTGQGAPPGGRQGREWC